jgi:hypothetical protein
MPRIVTVLASVYDTGVGNTMAACGPLELIDQVNVAGVASTLPAASRARTSKVWAPVARPVSTCGLVVATNVPPSRRDSKVAVSFAANVKVATVEELTVGGPELIVVSGEATSTTHEWVAGVASTLPTESRARTA